MTSYVNPPDILAQKTIIVDLMGVLPHLVSSPWVCLVYTFADIMSMEGRGPSAIGGILDS